MSKHRTIELQKSLKIAREALERISDGRANNPAFVAAEALSIMDHLRPKQQLQGVVGHTPKIALQGALNRPYR